MEGKDKIFVDRKEIPESEGIFLERIIHELEANDHNDEVFENLFYR